MVPSKRSPADSIPQHSHRSPEPGAWPRQVTEVRGRGLVGGRVTRTLIHRSSSWQKFTRAASGRDSDGTGIGHKGYLRKGSDRTRVGAGQGIGQDRTGPGPGIGQGGTAAGPEEAVTLTWMHM